MTSIDGLIFLCFDNGKILKINGTGGGGNNMFAVDETTDGFTPTPGYSHFAGCDKFPEASVTDFICLDSSMLISFSNGILRKIQDHAGIGNDMFHGFEIGYNIFYRRITDLTHLNNEQLIISLMDGRILKTSDLGNTKVKEDFLGIVQGMNKINADCQNSSLIGWQDLMLYPSCPKSSKKEILNSKGKYSISSDGFSFYPNPANNRVFIKVNDNNEGTVELFDMSGKLVFKKWIGSAFDIDVSSMNSGIYLIKFSNKNKVCVKKIIIN